MDNRWKNALYSLLLIIALVSVWKWRQSNKMEPILITGETMGTTYHITYFDKSGRNFKISVDSLLVLVNKSINNYDPSSEVSRFNKGSSAFQFSLPYLLPPIKIAQEVVRGSNGAFDPTVMPLVYVWGFGSSKNQRLPTKTQIDSITSTTPTPLSVAPVLKSHES